MLQQTYAEKVVPVYEAFIERYPSISALSRARVEALRRFIYPLGLLYRAERLRNMARTVMAEYGGTMPNSQVGLLSLPGVGRYIASAVMCFAYGKECSIIDVNVIRVLSRYFALEGTGYSALSSQVAKLAAEILPYGRARQFNYALLDFAHLVCSFHNPRCAKCTLRNNCTSRNKNSQSS